MNTEQPPIDHREGFAAQPFAVASDAFVPWAQELLSGSPPIRWAAGTGEMGRIDLRPGRIVLLGGPPGSGKTAFVLQLVVDALQLNPDLKALVANCEISISTLLARIISRLAKIPFGELSDRRLNESHRARLEHGFASFTRFAPNLAFLKEPFNVPNFIEAADRFDARLLVCDYVQRVIPRDVRDERAGLDAVMSEFRRLADCGACVVVVSSCGRQRDPRGRVSYSADALGLGSFRGSSELEYASDDCYLLPQADREGRVVCSHAKSRNSQPRDLELRFDGRFQTFTGVHDEPPASNQPASQNDWGAEW